MLVVVLEPAACGGGDDAGVATDCGRPRAAEAGLCGRAAARIAAAVSEATVARPSTARGGGRSPKEEEDDAAKSSSSYCSSSSLIGATRSQVIVVVRQTGSKWQGVGKT